MVVDPKDLKTQEGDMHKHVATCGKNAIMAIHPYQDGGLWVFDDADVGLRKEPFVEGADVIIDMMVHGIPGAAQGFTLLFSASQFPSAQLELVWQREEFGGNWYSCPALGLEGWLCPALLNYFATAPKIIYVQAKAKKQEVAR